MTNKVSIELGLEGLQAVLVGISQATEYTKALAPAAEKATKSFTATSETLTKLAAEAQKLGIDFNKIRQETESVSRSQEKFERTLIRTVEAEIAHKKALEGNTHAAAQTDKELAKLEAELGRLIGKVVPGASALANFQLQQQTLNRAFAQGVIDGRTHQELLGRLHLEYEKAAAKARAQADETRLLEQQVVQLTSRLVPGADAVRRFHEGQDLLNSALQRGVIDAKTHADLMSRLTIEHQKAAAKAHEQADEINRLEREVIELTSRLVPGAAAIKRFEEGQNLLNRALERGIIDKQQYSVLLQKLRHEHDTATRGVNTLQSAFSGLQSVVNMVRQAFFLFLGGSALGGTVKAMFDAGNTAQNMRMQFQAAAGTIGQGNEQLAFARKLADDMGLSFISTAQALQKFTAATENTKLEGESARQIFTAFAGAARVLGLSAGETSGMFLALEQMVSKGRISTEELRRQLGDRLPGAFRLAAEAMGVSTAELEKMLRQGTITVEDFLPKFAKRVQEVYGKSLPDASKTAQAQLERLANEWQRFKETFSENSGFMDLASGTLSILTERLKLAGGIVRDDLPYWDKLVNAFAALGWAAPIVGPALSEAARRHIQRNAAMRPDGTVDERERGRFGTLSLGAAKDKGPFVDWNPQFFGDWAAAASPFSLPQFITDLQNSKEINKKIFDEAMTEQLNPREREAAIRQYLSQLERVNKSITGHSKEEVALRKATDKEILKLRGDLNKLLHAASLERINAEQALNEEDLQTRKEAWDAFVKYRSQTAVDTVHEMQWFDPDTAAALQDMGANIEVFRDDMGNIVAGVQIVKREYANTAVIAEKQRQNVMEMLKLVELEQEAADDMVYTWDQFGNRLIVTKEQFKLMQEQTVEFNKVMGEATFSGANAFRTLGAAVQGVFKDILTGNFSLSRAITSVWKGMANSMVDELSRVMARTVLEPIFDPFKKIFEKIGKFIKEEVFDTVWDYIKRGFRRVWNVIVGDSDGSFSKMGQLLKDVFDPAWEYIKTGFTALLKWLEGLDWASSLSGLWNAVTSIFSQGQGGGGNIFSTLLNFAGGGGGGGMGGGMGGGGFGGFGGFRLGSMSPGAGGLGSAVGGAGVGMFSAKLTGGSPKHGAAGGAIGAVIGNMILPGVGGWIGSAFGGIVAGGLGKKSKPGELQIIAGQYGDDAATAWYYERLLNKNDRTTQNLLAAGYYYKWTGGFDGRMHLYGPDGNIAPEIPMNLREGFLDPRKWSARQTEFTVDGDVHYYTHPDAPGRRFESNVITNWLDHEAARNAPQFAMGTDSIVTKPTLIRVGEVGPERFTVSPLAGAAHKHLRGPVGNDLLKELSPFTSLPLEAGAGLTGRDRPNETMIFQGMNIIDEYTLRRAKKMLRS